MKVWTRLCLLVGLVLGQATYALDLELTQGINSALPVAVNAFGEDSVGGEMGRVIEHDLAFSGQFKIVAGVTTPVRTISVLKQMGADSVVSGRVRPLGGSRYEVSFDLADAVAQGRILLSKSYQIQANEARALAHHISDMVYQKLTGEKGIFSTRIAYILVQRGNGPTRYSLEVADVDGYNPQS